MLKSELLNERAVSQIYGLSIAWQRRCRREGRGPRFVKLGKMVRYRRSEIEAYLNAHEVQKTEARVKATPEGQSQ